MDSWDFENFLNRIDFCPGSNAFLDVLQYEQGNINIQEGPLDTHSLDEYLKNAVTNQQNGFAGGLRLIYSYVELDGSEDGDAWGENERTYWSRDDFIKITDMFKLPKRFAQMIGRKHCCMVEFIQEEDGNKPERFGYIFSTLFQHIPFWMMAASWDPRSNMTYAYLQCKSDPNEQSMDRVRKYLTDLALTTLHPMMLPIIIMDLETDLTLRDDTVYYEEITNIEDSTGGVGPALDVFALDLPSIVSRLNQASVFISKIERDCETSLLHMDKARTMILAVRDLCPDLEKQSQRLIRHVDLLVQSRKVVFVRLRNLQKRSQTRLSLTYTFLAQRDNKLNIDVARDSKTIALATGRDNIAMKTIAILTTAFLPGTFIAALFSLPLFDWQSNPSAITVNKNFWIYWSTALPLTAFVMITWFVWFRMETFKQDKKALSM